MTLDRFLPRVGETFVVTSEPDRGQSASLVLSRAERLPLATMGDRPFHLLFQGSDEIPLDQGLYWLGPLDEVPEPIFLVPVGPRLYEAVFN